jgi:hypothetical protein
LEPLFGLLLGRRKEEADALTWTDLDDARIGAIVMVVDDKAEVDIRLRLDMEIGFGGDETTGLTDVLDGAAKEGFGMDDDGLGVPIAGITASATTFSSYGGVGSFLVRIGSDDLGTAACWSAQRRILPLAGIMGP